MTDITERLRRYNASMVADVSIIRVMHNAANEIERLRAQLERLNFRLRYIDENRNDGTAISCALKATDEQIDDLKSKAAKGVSE